MFFEDHPERNERAIFTRPGFRTTAKGSRSLNKPTRRSSGTVDVARADWNNRPSCLWLAPWPIQRYGPEIHTIFAVTGEYTAFEVAGAGPSDEYGQM